MNPQVEAVRNGLTHLSEDAGSMINSTRESISEQVQEISDSLSTGCERGKGLFEFARVKGVACRGAVDQELQDHSYRYLVIIAGIGALFGFLIASRSMTKAASIK